MVNTHLNGEAKPYWITVWSILREDEARKDICHNIFRNTHYKLFTYGYVWMLLHNTLIKQLYIQSSFAVRGGIKGVKTSIVSLRNEITLKW